MIRTSKTVGQAGHGRYIRLDRERLHLVHVFVVEEEEQFVLHDGPAHPETGVAASKERVLAQRVPVQRGVGRHVVVAEKEIAASVKLVAALARDYVYRTHARNVRGKVEVHR